MDADSSLVTAVLPQPNHSGSSSKCYIVVHDIECPPGDHWAVDLGGPSYLQNPSTQASVQYIVDAANIVQGVAESDWAWGAGTPGSQHGIHIEQAGYASMSRSQWLGLGDAVGSTYRKPNGDTREYSSQDATDMASQFQLLARLIADICQRHGWRAVAASAEDLRQEVQGVNLGRHVRHLDISAWVGGTSHTDPGESYPWADLLTQATHYLDGTTEPTKPTTPDPPEDDDMPLNDADKAWIKQAIKDAIDTVVTVRYNTWDPEDGEDAHDGSLADAMGVMTTMQARTYRDVHEAKPGKS